MFYNYTFSKWLGISGEMIDPLSYPVNGIDDLLIDNQGRAIKNLQAWEEKVADIKKRVNWARTANRLSSRGSRTSQGKPGYNQQPFTVRKIILSGKYNR